jgi:hypothetical protein
MTPHSHYQRFPVIALQCHAWPIIVLQCHAQPSEDVFTSRSHRENPRLPPTPSQHAMDDVEIVVAKCKPLGQAKALAILSTFLRKDQAKQPDEQVRISAEWREDCERLPRRQHIRSSTHFH